MKTLRQRSRKLLRTGLWITFVASACVCAVYSVHWMPRVTHGFAMYYTYSRLLLEGRFTPDLFDADRFNATIASHGMSGVIDIPNNLPTTAIALLPFAWMPPATAKIAWTIVSLGLFVLSLRLLLQLYDVKAGEVLVPGLGALAFVWRPVYDTIALGQVYFLVLFLCCLTLAGIRRKGPLLTSLPVSISLALKGYGILPVIGMAVVRRWRSVVLAIVGVAVIVGAALPFLSADVWHAYLTGVLPTLGMLPSDAHVAYQTINGFVHHLFVYDAQWLSHPVISLPGGLVDIISAVLNLLIIVEVVRRPPVDGGLVLWFSAVIAAGVITSPLAEEYHFVLFLPYVFGLCAAIERGWDESGRLRAVQWIALAAIGVMAAPLRYKELESAAFPMILLAYPKLYAGVVLLLLRNRLTGRRESLGARSAVQPRGTEKDYS